MNFEVIRGLQDKLFGLQVRVVEQSKGENLSKRCVKGNIR